MSDQYQPTDRDYRTFMESTSDTVTVMRPDGTIFYEGGNLKGMYGYDPADLIGHSVFDYIHPDDLTGSKIVQSALAFRPGKPMSLVFRFLRKDGTYRRYQAVINAVMLSHGLSMVAVSRDADPAIEDHKAYLLSEGKYQALFENAQDAIILQKNGIFTDCNQSTTRLFGFTKEEFVGKTPVDISPERQPDGSLSREKVPLMTDRLQPGETTTFEWVHRKRDGMDFEAEVRVSCMDLDGERLLLGFIRDISGSKKVERALQESEQRYRSIVNTSPTGLFEYTLDAATGKLIMTGFNPASQRIIPIDLAPLVGKPVEEAFPGLAGTDSPAVYTEIARNGGVHHWDDFTYSGGTVSGIYMVDAFGIGGGSMVVAFSDITQRKKVEAEDKARTEELEKMNRFMVDRELRMTELKTENARLRELVAAGGDHPAGELPVPPEKAS